MKTRFSTCFQSCPVLGLLFFSASLSASANAGHTRQVLRPRGPRKIDGVKLALHDGLVTALR